MVHADARDIYSQCLAALHASAVAAAADLASLPGLPSATLASLVWPTWSSVFRFDRLAFEPREAAAPAVGGVGSGPGVPASTGAAGAGVGAGACTGGHDGGADEAASGDTNSTAVAPVLQDGELRLPAAPSRVLVGDSAAKGPPAAVGVACDEAPAWSHLSVGNMCAVARTVVLEAPASYTGPGVAGAQQLSSRGLPLLPIAVPPMATVDAVAAAALELPPVTVTDAVVRGVLTGWGVVVAEVCV
jgi:hypothetical protein